MFEAEYLATLDPTIAGLSKYMTLLDIAEDSDTHTTVEVTEARSFLNDDKAFNIIFCKLAFSTVGREVLSAVTNMLAVSGKDEIGDQKLCRAIKIITEDESEQLPSICAADVSNTDEDESYPTVSNFNLVSSMSVTDIYTDSVDHMSEALQLFQRKRLGENNDKIYQWLRLLVQQFECTDDVVSTHVAALSKAGRIDATTLPLQDPEAEHEVQKVFHFMGTTSLEQYQTLKTYICCIIDEEPLQLCISAAKTLISGMPQYTKTHQVGNMSVDDALSKLTVMEAHIDLRQLLLNLYEGLVEFSEVKDPLEALGEWDALRNSGAGEQSLTYFSKMLELSRVVAAIEETVAELTPQDEKEPDNDGDNFGLFGNLELSFSFPAGPSHGSVADLNNIAKQIRGEPLVRYVTWCLNSSVSATFEAFLDCINIGLIRCPIGPDDAPDDVAALLSRFCTAHDANLDFLAKLVVSKDNVWPARHQEILLNILTGTLAKFTVVIEASKEDYGPRWVCDSNKELLSGVSRVLLLLSKVASLFFYLKSKFCATSPESIYRDHKLKVEIENAVSLIKDTIVSSLKDIVPDLTVIGGGNIPQLPAPYPQLSQANEFFLQAGDAVNRL